MMSHPNNGRGRHHKKCLPPGRHYKNVSLQGDIVKKCLPPNKILILKILLKFIYLFIKNTQRRSYDKIIITLLGRDDIKIVNPQDVFGKMSPSAYSFGRHFSQTHPSG